MTGVNRTLLTSTRIQPTIEGMKLGRRLHPLIAAGFVFLILASVSRWIKPHSRSVEDLHDALTGLLYGLAIACMLFGIYKSTRRPDDTGATPNS